jgi:Zn-dependent protease
LNVFLEYFQKLNWDGLVSFLMQGAAVLLCLTVHEVSHGLAAYALGDPTAKGERRLSLNPLRHLDPFGTLMMLLFGFGWAKPVPVDMRYFKHPKSGMAITALAGPLSNFVLAFLALILANILAPLIPSSLWAERALNFLLLLASLSVGLGVFNLLPFPPLDGSKVVESLLPDRVYYKILRYEHFGILVLMAVLWTGILNVPLYTVRSLVMNWLLTGSSWAQSIGELFI